ncbi:PP2C family protein-serine/threonine phosphatase [Phytohabitans aurantiacus]|jgi:serine/threonine protein phosphatase PrpC|uniref:PP2C family protein-serine/threonine phosphatase n=1 Tax=Phytohabitans aurantiacus TaxID=3016789 RepID=UPI0024939D08|nr:protein phosphatase 2C domain-containing protein [Phytohabitans aurantiacus]
MSLILRAAMLSHVGLVRSNNEDSAFAGRRLLVIADGIGGLPAGELASDLIVKMLAPLDDGPEPEHPLASLREAVEAANRQIRETADAEPGREGMGSTVTSLLMASEQIALFHVGDSRAYLMRDGALSQLTKDDTYVQTLVDHGVLTPEEARAHPQRSVVTQAVQGDEFTPSGAILSPQAGDRYLLCSDGLSDYVSEEAIAATMRTYPDQRECVEGLVQHALHAGAPDNVSVIIADVSA